MAFNFNASFRLGTIAATFALASAGSLVAQTGVAPSQTGLFFDDFRQRSNQFRKDKQPDKVRSYGEYDYSRGEYAEEVAWEQERELGTRYLDQLDDEGRSLGQPAQGTAPTRRLAGDYSAQSGPYASTSTYFAPTYVSDPFLGGKRNIKVGPVNIGLGLNTSFEYNDNFNASRDNPQDEVVAGVFLNTHMNYQITENNRLTLTLGAGLDYYFNHPEYTSTGKHVVPNILPGSTLALDVKVGNVLFTFYDRISVRPVNGTEFALDDYDVFGTFQNDAGVAANWAINSDLNLSLNFNRSDGVALEDAFNIYDRVIHSLSGSLAWSPTGTFVVGLEGSFSWINYESEFNNDGETRSGGAFVIFPITKSTVVKVSGGVQEFDFDSPPVFTRRVTEADILNSEGYLRMLEGQVVALEQQIATLQPGTDQIPLQQQLEGLTAQRQDTQDLLAAQRIQKQQDDIKEVSRTYDNSDLSDYYFNVSIFSQLNRRVSQQLSFGHESSINTTSNFLTAEFVNYGISVIAWRGSRFTISGYYEEAEESGGRLAESTEQWGLDAFLSHRLTDRAVMGLGYHFGETDSNRIGRDYEQNAFTVDLNFSLNAKLNVGLGYRYLTTTAEDDRFSFDQNRILMTVNYNF